MESRRMAQAEFIHHYNDEHREKFNEELFKRDNQEIVDAVSAVIRSVERDKHFTLKVLSIDLIEEYEKIYDLLREHEQSKLKKGKTENIYDYIQMRDSDIMLLQVKYLIRKNGVDRVKINNVETAVENPEQVLEVLIALPRYVDKYYFRLSGNYYAPVTQIVDGSTYNNATTNNSKVDSVTLKTLFMSVRIFRKFKEITDLVSEQKIRGIVYNSIIFNSHVNAMYYIFAKYGYYATMNLFGINCIRVTEEPIIASDYVCFKKHNLYISCPRYMYEEPIVQSLCMTIHEAILKDTTLETIYNPRFWLMTLGGAFRNYSVDKGLSALDSLESIYDIPTKESIRLPEQDKANIYLVLKWLMCDFSALRAKDNTDISIKKRRIAEYIAHIYAIKISKGIHRICDLGKKVKLKQIISAVYTSPMYIISNIVNMSNLVSYVDMVNDNDAITALKCTYKGIAGLGEDGAAVQEVYRFVDASSIGILDPDTSSASDPGMTAMICPMTETYGDSFTPYVEPNTWREQINNLNTGYIEEQRLSNGINFSEQEDYTKYDYIKDQIVAETINVGRKICPLKDLDGVIDYSGLKRKSVIQDEGRVNAQKLTSLFTIVDSE